MKMREMREMIAQAAINTVVFMGLIPLGVILISSATVEDCMYNGRKRGACALVDYFKIIKNGVDKILIS